MQNCDTDLFFNQGIIDASEECYDATVDLAESMIDNDHYEKDIVMEKLNDLKDERSKMTADWDDKKVKYDQCMEYQLFNRDVEQMETIMATQEVCRIYFFNCFLLFYLTFLSLFLDQIEQGQVKNLKLQGTLNNISAQVL